MTKTRSKSRQRITRRRNRGAVEATGAEVAYLPTYSPDPNPIERCWSKLKTALLAAKARTREAIDEAVTRAFATITADDAAAWLAHSGYAINQSAICSRYLARRGASANHDGRTAATRADRSFTMSPG